MIKHIQGTQDPGGVVVYLSQPNRYDVACGSILSGPPGQFLRDTLRDNDVDPDQVTYTLDHKYHHPTAHRRILLGWKATRMLSPLYQQDPMVIRGAIVGHVNGELTSTFDPVDCTDVVSHEPEDFEGGDDTDDAGNNNKDTCPTQRPNFRFWFRADVQKLIKRVRRRTYKYEVITNFSTAQIIQWLSTKTNTTLYFDIETHPATETLQCFTIADIHGPAVVVGTYYHYGTARDNLPQLMAALTKAMQRNTIVGHNLMFDLGFLFQFHGVPFGRSIYDTMLAHHRMFPEIEKSLAHTMSYCGNFPQHKGDAGTFHPRNIQQYNTLLEYNARDVLVLREIHTEQLKQSANDPGLRASIDEANASVYPYLCMSFTGFEINTRTLYSKQHELVAQLKDIKRCLETLTGWAGFNPASGKQLAAWLFKGGLCYPVLETTDGGAPATDMKTLYRLLIKYPLNIALKLVILYKELDKVRGMLDFEQYHINELRK